MDGYRVIKQNELVGALPAVFILPEDIELTAGPASYQRQFLDLYISQYSKSYLDDLMAYRKTLQQRNKLLKDLEKSPRNKPQLEAWDELLIRHAAGVIKERATFVEAIAEPAHAYYEAFESSGELELAYRPRVEIINKDINAALANELENYRERELRAGLTLVGPHRDRLRINLNSRPVRHYSSRGQKRCAMLAIKLATAEYLALAKGREAALILDEVFAELDKHKSEALMNALTGQKQVFIATAGEFDFADLPLAAYHIDSGRISGGQ